MCGIAGCIFVDKYIEKDKLHSIGREMISKIEHRGPDTTNGIIVDSDGISAALYHARLSIIDLHERSNQPMISEDGNSVLLLNGEIYNYLSLRSELKLKGIKFRTDSDTEVLLNGLIYWGVTETLNKLDGMYAFVFLNRMNKSVSIARDNFGEKPLYYLYEKNQLFFASQVKAILAVFPDLELNSQSVFNYFKYSYIPAPDTIYLKVNKLQNGECCKFIIGDNEFLPMEQVARRSVRANDMDFGKKEFSIQKFNNILISSVESRFISDVPVGAFLSGGIDSSLVAAIATKELGKNLDTFTIKFEDPHFDESSFAENIAAELKIRNYSYSMSESDIINVINILPEIYDEPFCDSSQVPTVFLSEKVSRSVKVALTGDGGDELVFGYPRYQRLDRLMKRNSFLKLNNEVGRFSKNLQPGKFLTSLIWSTTGDNIFLYDYMVSRFRNLSKLFNDDFQKNVKRSLLMDRKKNFNTSSGFILARAIDLNSYLPEELLVKTDRASMYFGLELRTPFLNRTLFDYIDETTNPRNIHFLKNKSILKEQLNKYLPQRLFNRPKMGFAIPLSFYLKKYLKDDIIHEMTNLTYLENQGIFNVHYIEQLCKKYFNEKNSTIDYFIWSFYMFQKWYRRSV